MADELRRGATASVILHGLILAALLLAMPSTKPEDEVPETQVEMAFSPGPPTEASKGEQPTVPQ